MSEKATEREEQNAIDRGLTALAGSQSRAPGAFLAMATLLSLASLPLIFGLTLNSDFTAMLPESAQSVRDLDEIRERFGGTSSLTIAVECHPEGCDMAQVRRFVGDLARRIEGMEAQKVVSVDWNISDFRDFVTEHRFLYADLSDLRAIKRALDERLEYERAHANPFFIDLEEDEPPDPQAVIRRIERRAEEASDEFDRYPEGYFQHPSRPIVMLMVRTRIRGGEAGEVDALVSAIEGAARDLRPSSYAEGIEVLIGGDLMSVREETEALVEAVRNATVLTIVLVLLAIFVFFLRVRAIPLLLLAIAPPVLITFGIAEVTVDYLNASSAFLSSIVVGNGINPNVIWLARYFELRREGRSVTEAIAEAHRGTWRATLTAMLAAGLAYASLTTTDYRGFRDFGIVGGVGMLLCWVAAYTVLPALISFSERLRPMLFERTKGHRGFYGLLFAKLSLSSPRAILLGSAALTVGAAVAIGVAVAHDPMEYDFRNLQSERSEDSRVEYVNRAFGEFLDQTQAGSALAVLAPSREAVPEIEASLRRHLEEEDPQAFGELRTIERFLPDEQPQKIAVLREIRRLLLEVRPYTEGRERERLDHWTPPAGLRPVGPEALPESVARPFIERDGTRGRLLYMESHPEESNWDGAYLLRWSAAGRSIRVRGEDGESHGPPPVAGTAVVFADLLRTIFSEGPKSVAVAFFATVLLLILTFRRARDRWLTLISLVVGIVWMAGVMAVSGMKLNFLNFVAFPITFGNGVDYGVNVMRRYVHEMQEGRSRKEAIRQAVEGTGGAVILCSLTTVIGYISLYTSSNQALNSFGSAMAISEVTCLFSAVLALPAAIFLFGGGPDEPKEPERADGEGATEEEEE